MHMPSAISPTDYRFQELGFHLFSLQIELLLRMHFVFVYRYLVIHILITL